jgi:hypothetical protein
MPVVTNNKKTGFKLRCRRIRHEGQEVLQFLLEQDQMGTTPKAHVDLVYSFNDFVKVGASERERADLLLTEPGNYEGWNNFVYAGVTKKKLMMNSRLTVDGKYFYPQDNMFIMSSKGMGEFLEEYKKRHDCSKMVLTYTIISYFKFDPIYDKTDSAKVIGTKI